MTKPSFTAVPESHALPCGMRAFVERHPWRRNAAVGILVHTGARDEPPGMDGISHFLEHLCFKGTAERTSADINLQFDKMGAYFNAFTTEEATVYFAYAPEESVPEAVSILFDMMRPSLPPAEVETERAVVLEEIAMHKDIPQSQVFDSVMQLLYAGQPLGRSVIGETKTVAALTVDKIRNYQRLRYAPGNMAFIAVGKFDSDKVLKQAVSLASKLEPGAVRRERVAHTAHPGKKYIVRPEHKIEHLIVALPAPALDSPLRIAGEALELMLGDDYGSVYFDTITRRGLAESVSAAYTAFSDGGVMMLQASAEASAAKEVKRLLVDGYRAAEKGKWPEHALEHARQKLLMDVCQSSETPMGRFEEMAREETGGVEIFSLEKACISLNDLDENRMHNYFKAYPLQKDATAVAGAGPLKRI